MNQEMILFEKKNECDNLDSASFKMSICKHSSAMLLASKSFSKVSTKIVHLVNVVVTARSHNVRN